MKNTLVIIACIAAMLAGHAAFGQAAKEDVVYLKNGNILRGIIIEHVPNKSIKLQMLDRSVYGFTYEEIEKITQETRPVASVTSAKPVSGFKSSGYMFIAEIGFSAGMGTVRVNNQNLSNDDNALCIRTVHGAYLSEHISLGLGLGYEKYKVAGMIPVTFDLRATLAKGKASPIVGLNAGYALGLNEASNGFIVNPSFGLKTAVSEKTAFMFTVGYKWVGQEAVSSDYYYYYYSEKTEKVFFQFLTINAGFSF